MASAAATNRNRARSDLRRSEPVEAFAGVYGRPRTTGACGHDLSSDLVAYEQVPEPQLEELSRLTPHERLTRHDQRPLSLHGADAPRWAPLETCSCTRISTSSQAAMLPRG